MFLLIKGKFLLLHGNTCVLKKFGIIFFELFNVDSVVRFWTMHFLCHIFSLIANDCSFNSLKVCFHSEIELSNPLNSFFYFLNLIIRDVIQG